MSKPFMDKVLIVGNWLIYYTGVSTWEDWACDGLYLEGNKIDNFTLKNRFLYKIHYFKAWVLFKYVLPYKLRRLCDKIRRK